MENLPMYDSLLWTACVSLALFISQSPTGLPRASVEWFRLALNPEPFETNGGPSMGASETQAVQGKGARGAIEGEIILLRQQPE